MVFNTQTYHNSASCRYFDRKLLTVWEISQESSEYRGLDLNKVFGI